CGRRHQRARESIKAEKSLTSPVPKAKSAAGVKPRQALSIRAEASRTRSETPPKRPSCPRQRTPKPERSGKYGDSQSQRQEGRKRWPYRPRIRVSLGGTQGDPGETWLPSGGGSRIR